ncbi:MAG: lysine--tRNA ligase [Pseudomonadota bacterium]
MKSLDEIIAQRRRKAAELADGGVPLYPNDFRGTAAVEDIINHHGSLGNEELEALPERVSLAGRIVLLRDFGKAAFCHLQDATGRLQAYIQRDVVGPEAMEVWKRLDVGDIIGVRGGLFRTRTNELTLKVEDLRLLVKSLRPLPEKWHGLTDVEARYRQRYLDLMVNPEVRERFRLRSRIVAALRDFLVRRGYLEVETPMMQTLPGGAAAKPFKTFHQALGIDLYLRIAPELYLKRLLVGGLERVFEVNRNFRNEGLDTEHNPEFTMLEFYQAYASHEDLMTLTEQMFLDVSQVAVGGPRLRYQGHDIDLTPPWRRISLAEALSEIGGVPPEVVADREALLSHAAQRGVKFRPGEGFGRAMTKLFDLLVEEKLVQPTFITGYPTEVSPLSRRSDTAPEFSDRFEFFIAGKEIGNGFSELNDPDDQRRRFELQAAQREAGDEEAHPLDEDYVRALEFGMPPAAGEGVGIDRLVMLLTDSPSIRDVILFPHLRPEDT